MSEVGDLVYHISLSATRKIQALQREIADLQNSNERLGEVIQEYKEFYLEENRTVQALRAEIAQLRAQNSMNPDVSGDDVGQNPF